MKRVCRHTLIKTKINEAINYFRDEASGYLYASIALSFLYFDRVRPGAPFNGGDPLAGWQPFIGAQRLYPE